MRQYSPPGAVLSRKVTPNVDNRSAPCVLCNQKLGGSGQGTDAHYRRGDREHVQAKKALNAAGYTVTGRPIDVPMSDRMTDQYNKHWSPHVPANGNRVKNPAKAIARLVTVGNGHGNGNGHGHKPTPASQTLATSELSLLDNQQLLLLLEHRGHSPEAIHELLLAIAQQPVTPEIRTSLSSEAPGANRLVARHLIDG